MSDDEVNSPATVEGGPKESSIRARTILRVPKVWILPLLIPAVMIALVTAIYIGSVVDPVDHTSGLPVLVVNQDVGAATPSGHVDLGQSVVKALRTSPGVTKRLDVQTATLAQAKADMDRGAAYATVVIPSTFSASALLNAGYPAPTGTSPPGIPQVQLLENSRLGSLGVNLAAGDPHPCHSRYFYVTWNSAESKEHCRRTARALCSRLIWPIPSHSPRRRTDPYRITPLSD